MSATGEIVIMQFDGSQAVADAVADAHLAVRLKQQEDGENEFEDSLHSSQADLRAMRAYYLEPGGNFFIARDLMIGQLAGFVGLRKVVEEKGEIKRLAVMPSHRRLGLASRLIDVAVEWARDNGYKTLNLATGKDEKAKTIYEKAGFLVVGYDKKHEDHLMGLDLA